MSLTAAILELRDQYLKREHIQTYEDINNGDCVEFADRIVGGHPHESETLSNDNFLVENEEGWNGDGNDEWSKKWLTEFKSLPTNSTKVEELKNIIQGYHCWIYYKGKHYDAECPEGVENLFELPFFKRYLEEQ